MPEHPRHADRERDRGSTRQRPEIARAGTLPRCSQGVAPMKSAPRRYVGHGDVGRRVARVHHRHCVGDAAADEDRRRQSGLVTPRRRRWQPRSRACTARTRTYCRGVERGRGDETTEGSVEGGMKEKLALPAASVITKVAPTNTCLRRNGRIARRACEEFDPKPCSARLFNVPVIVPPERLSSRTEHG